jgi:hypothetical protein
LTGGIQQIGQMSKNVKRGCIFVEKAEHFKWFFQG